MPKAAKITAPAAIPPIAPPESFLLPEVGDGLAAEVGTEEAVSFSAVCGLEVRVALIEDVCERSDSGVTIDVAVRESPETLMIVWGTPGGIEVIFFPVAQSHVPDTMSLSQQK
jgi:hypothetical protein